MAQRSTIEVTRMGPPLNRPVPGWCGLPEGKGSEIENVGMNRDCWGMSPGVFRDTAYLESLQIHLFPPTLCAQTAIRFPALSLGHSIIYSMQT